MFKKFIIALAIAATISPGFAQKDSSSQEAGVYESATQNAGLAKYKQAMAKLDFLVGEWQPEATAFNPATGQWEAKELKSKYGSSVRVSSMEMTRGLYITIPGETQYMGALSYDVFQDSFRMVLNDSAMGLLDVYEGQFKNGALVMTNLKSGTFFTNQGQKLHGRLKFKPAAGSGWSLVVEMSADQGQNWFEAYRLNTTPTS